MILSSDLTLEAVLGGAVSANQPEFHVDYIVRDNSANPVPKPATLRGALNSTTDVTLLSPSTGRYSTQGFVAEVQYLEITNKDTASITLTLKTTDGSTDREKCKVTLQTNERITYAKGIWQAFTSDASLKTNAISYAEGTYTPTVTASSGTITTASATGVYTKVGREVIVRTTTTVTTNGTGAGALVITAPFTAVTTSTGAGRNSSGVMTQSIINSSTASINQRNYDNAYPAVDGTVVINTIVFNT